MTESYKELLAENEELRKSLDEAQEILRAIKGGEVDALVVSGPEGEQIFTLEGADHAYRILIEAMNDGAVIIISDGTILYCNRHFSDMVKYPMEKVIGSSFYGFIPTADKAAFSVLQKNLGRGELTFKVADESILPVYISVSSLQLSESQEVFSIVVTNLIEQKRKDEIVAAERLARSIIEQSAETIIVCDIKGRIIRFSNSALEILGCDPSLQSLDDLIDLKLPTGDTLYPVSAALHGEFLQQVEASFMRSDGTLFQIIVNSGPLKGANGNILGSIITLTDITKRKHAEEALRKSIQRLAILSDLSSSLLTGGNTRQIVDEICLKVMDFLDCHVFFNYSADKDKACLHLETYGGIAEEEACRLEWLDYGAAICGNVAKDGQIIVAENIPQTADPRTDLVKSLGICAYACHPLLNQREVIGTLSFGTRSRSTFAIEDLNLMKTVADNISNAMVRIEAEEEIRKARDVLEQRVQERTVELQIAKEELEVLNVELRQEIKEHKKTECELLKARDDAEAAMHAKAAFMANMSHELRTPMNSVIGMTSLLLEEDLTPDQRDFVETIRIGGDSLLSIINDILDFSRLEKERTELENQAFYLRGTIEGALDLIAGKAEEKKINLAYTIERNTPPTIIGDPIRLRQILVNLLDNAVKFTDKGEVLISVSSKLSDPLYEIHFAIKDSGIGIPPDKMNRLFESFSQVDNSMTKKYGGTGLGLAISKKLVELMGGSIWLESKVGKGSTIHFNILVEAVPGMDGARSIEPRLKGKRILIVDRNKTNRRILELQTKEWGMIPTSTRTSQEALSLVRSGERFDAAILEMDMPKLSGLALGKEIRKYNKTIPLLMLKFAGWRIESDLFVATLTKPIKPSQLYDILIDIMSRKSISEPIPSPLEVVSKHSSLKVLLAEDNILSQKVTLQMLKKLGFCADVVANGLEVLQSLERQHYDIILMDVRMPEMNGLEATEIIRQRWPDKKPLIIAVTAYGLDGDREKCLEAGMDDYISKPIKLEDLKNMLHKYIPPQAWEKASSKTRKKS